MASGKNTNIDDETLPHGKIPMKRVLGWIWKTGILSTFLAGLFVLLPIVISVSIMAWGGGTLAAWLGGDSFVGQTLSEVGLHFVTDPMIASVLGWVGVLLGVWLLGVVLKSVGKRRVEMSIHSVMERIPLVNILYRPVAQVVEMLQRNPTEKLQGMNVVYCAFGGDKGAGFLGLRVSDELYQFNGQACQIVYVPTSPLPMSGCIVFAAVDSVHRVNMSMDGLMKIYLSIGVMSSTVIPHEYVVSRKSSNYHSAPSPEIDLIHAAVAAEPSAYKDGRELKPSEKTT